MPRSARPRERILTDLLAADIDLDALFDEPVTDDDEISAEQLRALHAWTPPDAPETMH